jgi:hypothetical protein
MNRKQIKGSIVGGVALLGVLAGAGVVYAAGSDGTSDCSPLPSLSRAVGPNGSGSADAENGSEDGPLCVAPVAPVAPDSH